MSNRNCEQKKENCRNIARQLYEKNAPADPNNPTGPVAKNFNQVRQKYKNDLIQCNKKWRDCVVRDERYKAHIREQQRRRQQQQKQQNATRKSVQSRPPRQQWKTAQQSEEIAKKNLEQMRETRKYYNMFRRAFKARDLGQGRDKSYSMQAYQAWKRGLDQMDARPTEHALKLYLDSRYPQQGGRRRRTKRRKRSRMKRRKRSRTKRRKRRGRKRTKTHRK